MNSRNFYYTHDKEKDLCSVFCVTCNKIAYSTKENKYLKDQECTLFTNLQCLNSSCPNGFSKTYQHYVVDNRRKIKKRNVCLMSSISTSAGSNYMERYLLN